MKKALMLVASGAVLTTLGVLLARKSRKNRPVDDEPIVDWPPMTVSDMVDLAQEYEGEAIEANYEELRKDAARRQAPLCVECAGRRIELDTKGRLRCLEDDKEICSRDAAWWVRDGNYRILVLRDTYPTQWRWLLFFKLDASESYFEEYDMDAVDGVVRLHPDYLMAVNDGLEVVPLCAYDGALFSDDDVSTDRTVRIGKGGYVEIARECGGMVHTSTAAFFDEASDELVACDAITDKCSYLGIKGSEVAAYIGSVLIFEGSKNGQKCYGLLRPTVSTDACSAVYYVDSFGEYDFERFVKACRESGFAKTPFYHEI
ncbi:hypothetical protein IJ847_01910 [Candidatus Saccharibacteria bacterium]|nr:hypothetical protein [Candidatus Saccharibacteria bacterium]